MLRIHFTPADVSQVRIAPEPDPMWETVLSLFRLRRPGPAPIFGRWHAHARRATRRSDLDVLLPLVRVKYYPDFLTPADGVRGLDFGLEAVLSTPATRLRGDMGELGRLGEPTPSWMRHLADGDPFTLTKVTGALQSHHDAVVAPFWDEARAAVEADRARRARILLDRGYEGLLDSFRPMMRWNPPVLEIDVIFEQTIRLDGRGLLLVPSFLSWSSPDVLRDTSLPPVLVYPVDHDLTVRAGRSVEGLIGRTRTSVLESIGDGSTTTELARRIGVSAASISQHTAVLREARLIHTTRVGKAVLHTVTPLGAALLGDAGAPRP